MVRVNFLISLQVHLSSSSMLSKLFFLDFGQTLNKLGGLSSDKKLYSLIMTNIFNFCNAQHKYFYNKKL